MASPTVWLSCPWAIFHDVGSVLGIIVHLACKLPLFLPNLTMVIMANWLNSVSSEERTFHQTVRSLSPCAVANCTPDFFWWFCSSVFFLAEWPFRLFPYRTHFTVDIDDFVPVTSSIFTRSFLCQRTFIRRRLLSLVVWQFRDLMAFILLKYCLCRWTRYLSDIWKLFLIYDKPDLWRPSQIKRYCLWE